MCIRDRLCVLEHHSCKRKLRRLIRKVKNPNFVPNTRLARKVASLLVWYQLIDPKYMRPPPQLIVINHASSDENSLVECVLFEKVMQCCCDSGAHKCIMSYDTFECLNISPKKLDKRQMYNIKTAVGTDFNAILGAVTVPMTFYNVNEKTERVINHPFLVLSCLLYTSPSPRDRTRSRMPSSA